MITVDQFRLACRSLKGYFGVVGMFGGNPAISPLFKDLCVIMREEVPYEQRGLWCNDPITLENARVMRETFNPTYSNLNVHLDKKAYDLFKDGWPECHPVGLHQDSRHSPVHLAMKDVIEDEGERNRLISTCDINQHWSAMIGVFRGGLRAWFCEVAGAQAMLHQHVSDYPDTGIDPTVEYKRHPTLETRPLLWWQLPMHAFADQVKQHCHSCGVPLRGYGELACADDDTAKEQTSRTHAGVYKPKRRGRAVELVTTLQQLGKPLARSTDYLGNSKR